MKKIEKLLDLSMIIVLFIILVLSIYNSLIGKQYALAVVSTSILFSFVFLMCNVGRVKDFKVSGKDISIEVNQGKDEPKE